MGDRGNIAVMQHERDGKRSLLYFYSHWGGYELPKKLQSALSRRERWDDESYLARIIFCEMIDGDVKGETGFGISSYPGDNEYNLLVVDAEEKKVHTARFEDPFTFLRTMSFEDFCCASSASLDTFRGER